MKKYILILIFILLSINLFSQSITNKLYAKNIGMYFDCSLNQKIDLAINDTSYYLFCSFQNMTYSTITDIGSIYCGDRKCMEKLLSDLKKIIELYNQNPSIEYEVESGMCRLSLRGKNLWIYDKSKYTYLNIKYMLKFNDWLTEVLLDKRIK
jgi:hypothetical protein